MEQLVSLHQATIFSYLSSPILNTFSLLSRDSFLELKVPKELLKL